MRERIAMIVREKRMLTPAICRIELGCADERAFQRVEPGAHITLHTPAGIARSYSITDTTPEGWLAITIARDSNGRGGSISAVDDTEVGARVEIDEPANAFPLVDAVSYLLIAGGIGITPVRSMFHHLREKTDVDVRLLYLTRSADATVYLQELGAMEGVTVRHSDRVGRLDLWPYLADPDDATHVYCCAGPSLMEEVRVLTMHWRPSHIHFEDFAGVDATDSSALPFRAIWSPTNMAVEVRSDQTLLGALRSAGIHIESSCESGTCGTCVLRLVEGEAQHRDLVLTPEEQRRQIMACVSRAASDAITVAPA